MTVFTQKLSKLRFAAVIRAALALFVVVFGAAATLAQGRGGKADIFL